MIEPYASKRCRSMLPRREEKTSETVVATKCLGNKARRVKTETPEARM